jgi:hypothetical protein
MYGGIIKQPVWLWWPAVGVLTTSGVYDNLLAVDSGCKLTGKFQEGTTELQFERSHARVNVASRICLLQLRPKRTRLSGKSSTHALWLLLHVCIHWSQV